MKHLQTAILFLFLELSIFASDVPMGTVTEDIQFTTYNDKSYSLFELLDKKTHIYCATFKYPFWPGYLATANRMGKYWEYYGCDECEQIEMFTFLLNIDTLITPWHIAYGNSSNLVTRDKGGTEFFELLGGQYVAGKEFLIKPDSTWESTTHLAQDSTQPAIESEFFQSHGIYEHIRCTHCPAVNPINNANLKSINLQPKSIQLSISEAGNYSIQIFTVQGTVLKVFPNKQLTVGFHTIPLQTKILPAGMYLVSLSNGIHRATRKVTIK